MHNAERLARIQRWLGIRTYAEYLGVETRNWQIADFTAWIEQLGSNKPDTVYVKVGEYGQEWYGGRFDLVRHTFLDHGIGCVPYVFCRPAFWQADAAIAAKNAVRAGGVCLDCEEQWLNNNTQLYYLMQRTRTLAGPDPVIIVSGYGDPITAVPGWDFGALQPCDAYQPQWYLGWWSLYHARGYQAAIAWGDGQCYQRFVQDSLGADFPIQPAMNVENVTSGDVGNIAHALLAWQTGVTVWEARDITVSEREELRSVCSPIA